MLRSLQTKVIPVAAVASAVAALGLAACGTPNQFGLAQQSQSFGQKIVYNTKVDVLMVVDNSGSMGAKQQQLSQGFAPFINYLGQQKFDYHVAVTTMDMSGTGAQGRFVGNPTVITNGTPNVGQAFINNVSVGTSGSDLSRGLQAMATALSPNYLSSVNAGFFRQDALLAIVFMSDEDDGSANSSQYYIDGLNAGKPPFPSGQMSWVANSIVVTKLNDPSCTTLGQYASPGYRYMDLSNASGGAIESICSADLVQASQDINNRIVEDLTAYTLPSAADPSTIKVFVNGQLLANDAVNGWTYNATNKTITFHGAGIPPADAVVQVSYTPTSVSH